MKSVLLFSFFLFQLNAFAEKMVFLVEGPTGKHVGVSTDFRSFNYLTHGSSWNLYPTVSSDGTQIAYVTGKNQKSLKLVLKNLKTAKEYILSPEGFVLHPQFAQNGKKLFFTSQQGGINKIAIVDLEKISSNQLPKVTYLASSHSSFFPAPFQSGESVVIQRNNTKKEIVMIDILNNKEIKIGEGMAPALSKDERFIAYTSKVDNNWDVFVYDRFSKNTSRVTKEASRDFSPTFDRFNNLIYTSDRLENGVFSIFKQSKLSWSAQKYQEDLLITKPGVSFYAPRISGKEAYNLSLKPKMTGEPRSSFGAISHGDMIYAVGGHQGAEHTYPPESFTGRVTVYDKINNQWLDRAPRLNKSHGFQLAAKDNYIYAFGGFAYEARTSPKWKSLSVVEQYDETTNRWKEIGDMPRRRSSNAAITVNNKVYLIGGWDATPKFEDDIDGIFHDEIDVFDLNTKEWSTLVTKLPKKRRAFSAFERNGKIYLLGGISEGGSHFSLLDDFTEFDPKTETFKELARLPFGTFAPAAGTLKNKAFIFGGMLKTDKWDYEYIPHIYSYDFISGTWVHTGRYMSESKGFSQVVLMGDCLGVLGGHSYQNNQDKPLSTFEKFCF